MNDGANDFRVGDIVQLAGRNSLTFRVALILNGRLYGDPLTGDYLSVLPDEPGGLVHAAGDALAVSHDMRPDWFAAPPADAAARAIVRGLILIWCAWFLVGTGIVLHWWPGAGAGCSPAPSAQSEGRGRE